MTDKLPFHRWNEAMELIKLEQDPVMQAVLEKVNATVAIMYNSGNVGFPEFFDQAFFLVIIKEIFSNPDQIKTILDNKYDRWFDD